MKLYQPNKNKVMQDCKWCGFCFDGKPGAKYCTGECQKDAKRELDRTRLAEKRLNAALAAKKINLVEYSLKLKEVIFMPPIMRMDVTQEEIRPIKSRIARWIYFRLAIMKLLIEAWATQGKASHDPDISTSGRNA